MLLSWEISLLMFFMGELSPGRAGFGVAKTKLGTLNISLWTYARYLNSTGLDPISFDDSGKPHDVTTRNDIQLSKNNPSV